MKLLFIDTETTGLDLERHEVWEFAAIAYDSDDLSAGGEETHLIWEPTWLEHADPGAIKVNNYYERMAGMAMTESGDGLSPSGHNLSDPYEAAKHIARLCAGALIVGNNPGFDEMFLTKFCREQSQVFANFHRKINVTDLALGYLQHQVQSGGPTQVAMEALALPHSSTRVLKAAGCPDNQGVHTALGDARHVRDAFFHLWRM